MKPGWQTTEFWLTLAATIIGGLLASGAITNSTVLQVIGWAGSALTALGYSITRAWVKTADVKASIAPVSKVNAFEPLALAISAALKAAPPVGVPGGVPGVPIWPPKTP